MKREGKEKERKGERSPDWNDWVTLLFKICQIVGVEELGLGEVGDRVSELCFEFLSFLETGEKKEKEGKEGEWDLSCCSLAPAAQKLFQKALSILSSTLSSLPPPSSLPFSQSLPPHRSSLAEGLVLVGLLRVKLLLPYSGVDPRMKHTTRRQLLEKIADGVREEVRMREVMGRREVGAPVELLVERKEELERLQEEIGGLRWKEIRRGGEGEDSKNDYEAVVRVMNHLANSIVSDEKVCGLFSHLLSASSDRLSQVAEEEVFFIFFSFFSLSLSHFIFSTGTLAETYLSHPL